MKTLIWSLPLLSALALPAVAQKQHPALPTLRVPQGSGVNIHFTDARPGELNMLTGAYRIVRMDFGWGGTEKKKGVYDFAAFDRLMKSLDEHKVRALFILDYSNGLYDGGLSPHTDEGRAAMAKWAAAAVTHFKGRGILWEMYNEPNGGFWKPQANVEDYIKLDKAVAAAIRKAAPRECYFGAATSTIDMRFLEACFKSGALERWDAVSVHPYRQQDPETAAREYRELRLMIERYKPKGKAMPILSGEWGYSTAWEKFNYERQGKYLPRQWMVDLMNDVPLSIWYDWHDNGTDVKESEHHFGSVEFPYHENRDPVYDPKPGYTAAKTFTQYFEGYTFNKRLALDAPEDYLLVFTKGQSIKLAAWTTQGAHEITVPASPGTFHGIDYLGAARPDMTAEAGGFRLKISDAPVYLEATTPNAALRAAAAWRRVPLDTWLKAPQWIPGFGANGAPAGKIFIDRNWPSQDVTTAAVFEGATFRQASRAEVTNPLHVALFPGGQKINVKLENPSGEALSGKVSINGGAAQDVVFKAGESEKSFAFPGSPQPQITARFEGAAKGDVVETTRTFRPLAAFGALTAGNVAKELVARPDGDAAIASEQTLSIEQPAEGASPGGGLSLKLSYRFATGWKFANLQGLTDAWKPIEGQPKALGLWFYGDGSGNVLRMRYTDSGGQTFQPGGTPVNWKGWRYYEFPLDGSGGSWGGAGDAKVHYPIQLESLAIFDSNKKADNKGAVYFSTPMWIY